MTDPYGPPPGYPPPPGYGYGYGYGQRPPQQGWNGFAIAGFVLSFFCSLLGLILSIIGLNQCRMRNQRGAGLAIAGIAVSAVSILLVIVAVIAQNHR